MRPGHAAREDLLVSCRELLADLRTGTVPRVSAAEQALAGLVDQSLDLLTSNAQDRRDFVVRMVAEFEQHERCSLFLRQSLHILDHLAQLLAALNLVCQAFEEWTLDGRRYHFVGVVAGADL
jgi:hypothetical protein